MNILFFLLLSFFFVSMAASGQNVQISGHLNPAVPIDKVFLYIPNEKEMVADSSDLKNGYFTLKTDIKGPTLAYLFARYGGTRTREAQQRGMIFLEPGKIKVSSMDLLEYMKVAGSPSHKSFTRFEQRLNKTKEKILSLRDKYRLYQNQNNEEGMNRTKRKLEKLILERNEKIYAGFIEKNNTSPVSLYVLELLNKTDFDRQKVSSLFHSLSEDLQQSYSGSQLRMKIEE